MQKGFPGMSTSPLSDARTSNIVPLFPDQEQAGATTLARYWDARLQGQPGADTDLEPELRDMVQLLEHYREVARPVVPESTAAPPWRTVHYTALAVLAAPGFLTATILTFAHTVGEFGVVLMIGGKIPGVTRVASVQIYDHVEALEYSEAHRLAAVMLVFSFVVLLVLYAWRPGSKKAG